MKGIVDRIQGNYAIVEIDGQYINYELRKFPSNIKEGDLVEKTNGSFTILAEETEDRRKKIQTLFDSLLEKDN